MESPRVGIESPQILSPSNSGRRSSDSKSPEFEFWKVRNPSFPRPNLLSADELIVDGVLLPLHLLNHNSEDLPDPTQTPPASDPPEVEAGPGLGPELISEVGKPLASQLTPSKRWKDVFKSSDRKNGNGGEKEKRKERKGNVGGGNGASTAELNIYIWPFSRSRSAGNSGNRPRMVAGSAGTRKVSSAPCSRSNSAGESKSRKWPSSPSRGGVHLGRSSPVRQVRRGSSGLVKTSTAASEPVVVHNNAEKGVKNDATEIRRGKTSAGSGRVAKVKVLSLNVPTCIGYRSHLTCRSDENSSVGAVATENAFGSGSQSVGGRSGKAVRGGGHLFSLRSIFTKKVY